MDGIQSNTDTTNHEEPKGLNIFDLWAIVKVYLWELVKFSWVIVGLAIFGGWYLFNRKSKDPIQYNANLTFILDKEAAKSQQSVLRLFNNSVGSGGSNDVNLVRLQELLITRKMSELSLFSKASMNTKQGLKEDYLINHYLSLFGPRYVFEHDSTEVFTAEQNRILLSVHSRLTRTHLKCKISPSNIITLTFRSTSERFSKEFLEKYYTQLDSFYYEKAVAKHKIILKAAEERKIQLGNKLAAAQSTYAKHEDKHLLYTQSDVGLKNKHYEAKLRQATQDYLVALNSLDAAQATLDRQSPVMQIIDPPIYPLPKFVPDARLHMLVGGVGGGAFAFFLIVARKFFSDFLRKEREKLKKREATKPTSNQDENIA
ncbi:MAG: hypothetical protein GY810_11985 [Aureispira sp.]|nr:hypothetical protein [Aureispira sp.]